MEALFGVARHLSLKTYLITVLGIKLCNLYVELKEIMV